MKLDFFLKLKYQLSTIHVILSVGIKYFARDLLCGIDNYA